MILREPLVNIYQSSDILSDEPVRRLTSEDQVILDLGKGKLEIFSKEYLRSIIHRPRDIKLLTDHS